MLELVDVSQHSHEIGLANLPFTRRGRRAQAAAKAAVAGHDPSVPPASPSQPGGSCLDPNLTTGQVAAHMRPHPQPSLAFSSPYLPFPSMSVPLPHGFRDLKPPSASSSAAVPAPA